MRGTCILGSASRPKLEVTVVLRQWVTKKTGHLDTNVCLSRKLSYISNVL